MLPGMSRSTVSAERSLAGDVASWVVAGQMYSRTSPSTVCMDKTVVDVLGPLSTDLILRDRNSVNFSRNGVREMIVAIDLAQVLLTGALSTTVL